jgi:hypothetical protein
MQTKCCEKCIHTKPDPDNGRFQGWCSNYLCVCHQNEVLNGLPRHSQTRQEWEEEFEKLYIVGDLGIDLSSSEKKRRNEVPLKNLKAFISRVVAQAEARGAEEFYKNLQTRLPEMLEEKGGEFETYLLQVKAAGAAEERERIFKEFEDYGLKQTFDQRFIRGLFKRLSQKVDN